MKGGKYPRISLQFSGFKKVVPIFVVCKMTVMDRMGKSMNPTEFKRTVVGDEEYNLPLYFWEEMYPRAIAWQIKVSWVCVMVLMRKMWHEFLIGT
ncbi:hypothetical protein TNIN_111231 [Trichonephila inaurata madagascariensis]|nr:hypothetical protein TNIN_111231 [Trichonephila inaurata madagascariensis]